MAEEKDDALTNKDLNSGKQKGNVPSSDLISLYGEYYRQKGALSFRGAAALSNVFGPAMRTMKLRKQAKDKHFEELMATRNTLFDASLIPEGTESQFKEQLLVDGKQYRDIAKQLAGMSPNHKYYDALINQMNEITGRYEQAAHDAQIIQTIRNQELPPEEWAYLPDNERDMYMDLKAGDGSNLMSIGGSMYYVSNDVLDLLSKENSGNLSPGIHSTFGGRFEESISLLDAIKEADSTGNFTIKSKRMQFSDGTRQPGGKDYSGNVFDLFDIVGQEGLFYKKISGLKTIPMKHGGLENHLGKMVESAINDGIKKSPFIPEFYRAQLTTLFTNSLAGKNGLMSAIFDPSNLYDTEGFIMNYMSANAGKLDLLQDILPKPTHNISNNHLRGPNFGVDLRTNRIWEHNKISPLGINPRKNSDRPTLAGDQDPTWSLVEVFPELDDLIPRGKENTAVERDKMINKLFNFYMGLDAADKQRFMYFYDRTQFKGELGLANTLLEIEDKEFSDNYTIDSVTGAMHYADGSGAKLGEVGDGKWGENSKAAELILFQHWGVKHRDGTALESGGDFDLDAYIEDNISQEDIYRMVNLLKSKGHTPELEDAWKNWFIEEVLRKKHSLQEYGSNIEGSATGIQTRIINIKDAVGGVPESGYARVARSAGEQNPYIYSWTVEDDFDYSKRGELKYDKEKRIKPDDWSDTNEKIVIWYFDHSDNKWKVSQFNSGGTMTGYHDDDEKKFIEDLGKASSTRGHILEVLKNKSADY